jgi:8-hydroxy-5-deazaflavin:NADPH oxidoreductase
MSKQSVAIIGAGNVGIAVGGALQRAGHEVVYGLREGSSSAAEVTNAGGTVVPMAEAARRPIVLLAVPARALPEAIAALGDLAGKIVIDATNSFANGPLSGAEQLQALVPKARVVKAFNTTGAENMGDAKRLAHTPFMPICGDDDAAKGVVLALARDAGFEAIDVGPLKSAGLLESLAHLWVDLVRRGGGRDFAFALTRKR